MVDSPPSSSSSLILSFVIGSRCTGFAVLDGFGLAPGGFRSVDLQRSPPAERSARLARFATRAIRRYRPTHVVLGVPSTRRHEHLGLTRAVRATLRRANVPWSTASPADACKVLLGRPRPARRGDLARVLPRHFRLADALPKR